MPDLTPTAQPELSSMQRLAALFGGGKPAINSGPPAGAGFADTSGNSALPGAGGPPEAPPAVPDPNAAAPSSSGGLAEALKALMHFFSGPAGAPKGQMGQLGVGAGSDGTAKQDADQAIAMGG